MGNGCYITNKGNVKASCLKCTQGSFSTRTRAFYVNFDILHPMLLSLLRCIIRCKLGSKRCALA